MKSKNKKPVKGFRDWTGKDAVKREKLVETLKKNFKLYGFEPAETPIIEDRDFVMGENEGDEAVSDTYKLIDKGKRKLALRYEFTFQLERIAKNKKLPYKRYQIGPVFRDEPTKGNRYRQFTQCDIDIVGSSKREESEILALVSRNLNELGIDFTINVNNRKLLNEILQEQGVNINDREEVIKIIDKLDKKKEKDVAKELEKYGCKNILKIFKKDESYFEKYDSYDEIAELEDYCESFGVKVNFLPSLARGLSYYNGSIYEVKTKKFKETIVAGGSFMVKEKQATGISFGLERLTDLFETDFKKNNVLAISINQDDEAIKMAEKLRGDGTKCGMYYDKISKALEYANSKDIKNVVFVGEEEIKNKKFKLKDMESGNEKSLGLEELSRELKRG